MNPPVCATNGIHVSPSHESTMDQRIVSIRKMKRKSQRWRSRRVVLKFDVTVFVVHREQVTCLNLLTMGSGSVDCRNGFDEYWFGTGRKLTSILCNNRRDDECSSLRQYIEQSWTSSTKNETSAALRIPFRSYCDTFENLATREDENLRECQHWWICREDQRRCGTGQCVEHSWFNDGEWDCPDASDEFEWMKYRVEATLRRASRSQFHRSILFHSFDLQ